MRLLDPKHVNRVCGAAILAFTLYAALRGPWDLGSLTDAFGDYRMNESLSLEFLELEAYPPNGVHFVYPPPSVLFRASIAKIGGEWAVVLWLVILEASLLGSLWMLAKLTGLALHRQHVALTLLAYLAVRYYVDWDLEAVNCNSMFLALVLGSVLALRHERNVTSGFLLAASVALKLYSFLLLPYLLIERRFKALTWSALSLAFFFFVVPALAFSPRRAVEIEFEWIGEVVRNSNDDTPRTSPAYLVSLHKALLVAVGNPSESDVNLAGGVVSLGDSSVHRLTQVCQIAWLSALAIVFFLRKRPTSDLGSGRRLAMDAATLSIAVLPLSPLLQPHQCVVTLIPTALFLSAVVDPSRSRFTRISLGASLVAGFLLLELGPSGPHRGLGVMAHAMVLLAGCAILERDWAAEKTSTFTSAERPRARAA